MHAAGRTRNHRILRTVIVSRPISNQRCERILLRIQVGSTATRGVTDLLAAATVLMPECVCSRRDVFQSIPHSVQDAPLPNVSAALPRQAAQPRRDDGSAARFIHGYSAGGTAFNPSRYALIEDGQRRGRPIITADVNICTYISLNNEITITDVAEGLDRTLRSHPRLKDDSQGLMRYCTLPARWSSGHGWSTMVRPRSTTRRRDLRVVFHVHAPPAPS